MNSADFFLLSFIHFGMSGSMENTGKQAISYFVGLFNESSSNNVIRKEKRRKNFTNIFPTISLKTFSNYIENVLIIQLLENRFSYMLMYAQK